MSDLSTHTKAAIDTASVSMVLATIAGWLPAIAALLSIIWSLLRIYETKTVQKWLSRLRGHHNPCEECAKLERDREHQD